MPYILKAQQLETQVNKVDSLDGVLTAEQYPTAQAVVDALNEFTPSIDESQLVGKKTDFGGEIFNDYENNQALNAYTTSHGSGNISGGKAFTITATEDLGNGTGKYTLSSITGLETNMQYSAVLSIAEYHAGKIIAIDGNVVTVDGYIYHDINPNKDDASNFNVFNCFIITGRPDLGDKDIGFNAFALGNDCYAQNVNSIAAGRSNRALGKHSAAFGYNNIVGHGAFAEGGENKSLGQCSHTEGSHNIATRGNTHAEGTYTQALFDNAHAEGSHTIAGTATSGHGAHAEGRKSQALGNAAHAEGNETKATADYAHAEGDKSEATGIASHAEAGGKAQGLQSHAEGSSTASGLKAHAEGSGTQAIGNHSHTEGEATNAKGSNAHSEGAYTYADGNNSHSGGWMSIALSENSFAHGTWVIANAKAQTAIGEFNDTDSNALFIIGNGKAAVKDTDGNTLEPEVRQNAFKVMKTGNVELNGGLIKGVGTPIDDTDVANKKYVDGAIPQWYQIGLFVYPVGSCMLCENNPAQQQPGLGTWEEIGSLILGQTQSGNTTIKVWKRTN